MKRRRLLWVAAVIFGLLVIGTAFTADWVRRNITPTSETESFYVRYKTSQPLVHVLEDLQKRGVVRHPQAMSLYAAYRRAPQVVTVGTYEVCGGMTADEVLFALRNPIQQKVRFREGFWIARSAPRLEEYEVCSAAEYVDLAQRAEEFQGVVEAPIPESGSLEGYLFPDTYELPPLYGARETIELQLKTFERKVWIPLGRPDRETLRRAVIIGSMVELEAGVDDERPVIAGVIENRIKRGMPLQIDATVLYALQEWRTLYYKDYRETKSPYNTYLHRGLPPGPIGSPGFKSIEAATKAEDHDFLYYVARLDLTHMFAKDYDQHLKNIQVRRKLLAERKAAEEAQSP